MLAATAAFAIGVAFAAQPTAEYKDEILARAQPNVPWVPGSNMLMSGHESGVASMPPPR